jgi:glucose-1-phosphate cytidylyltransferase
MAEKKSNQVVILCGGQGTRLREETATRPKPMVNIGERPILWHVMKIYGHAGFNRFVLCLGYKGEMIKKYFLDYKSMNNDFTINSGKSQRIELHNAGAHEDMSVTLADTGPETMTGARIKRIERYIDTNPFCATYADGLSDIDVGRILEFHKSHGKLATVMMVQPVNRFGILETDETGRVLRFSEKPRHEAWINAGFFVFDKRVFEYLDSDPGCILEVDPLPHLARDGELMAYRHDGFFYAMDTYRECEILNDMWRRDEAPWAVWRT